MIFPFTHQSQWTLESVLPISRPGWSHVFVFLFLENQDFHSVFYGKDRSDACFYVVSLR